MRSDGQRGHLSLHILYMMDSFLYVMCHTNTNHHEETQDTHSCNQEDSSVILVRKNDESSAVRRLIVANRSSLPEWIPEQGTVMQRAVLKDVMVWRGEYSMCVKWCGYVG